MVIFSFDAGEIFMDNIKEISKVLDAISQSKEVPIISGCLREK